MEVIFLIGRILFVLLFVMSGVQSHLVARRGAIDYARAYGAPAPEITVPLTGLMILAGGLMIGFGVLADLGAILVGVFLVVITPIMHAFWKEQDEQMKQMQMANFLKNFALLGAAAIIFYAYNQLQGDAGLSLTDPLFNRG